MSSKSFSKYLSEIGEIPLLTREREAELRHLVQTGGRSDATLREQEASEEAQCELVRHNLKLAVSVATGFLRSSLTLEELGGAMGSGNQYVSWIHVEDYCRAVEWLIQHDQLAGKWAHS